MKTFKKGDLAEYNYDRKKRYTVLVTTDNPAPIFGGVVIESGPDQALDVGHYANNFNSVCFVKTNKIIKVEDEPKPTFKFGDKIIYTGPDNVEYNAIFLSYSTETENFARVAFESGSSAIKPIISIELLEEV